MGGIPVTHSVPHQRPKNGGRSLHLIPPPSCGAPSEGAARGAASLRCVAWETGKPVMSPPMRRWGETPNHNGEGFAL